MAHLIWSNAGNPTNTVARQLRISREQLGEAIHTIKRYAGLTPVDRVNTMDL